MYQIESDIDKLLGEYGFSLKKLKEESYIDTYGKYRWKENFKPNTKEIGNRFIKIVRKEKRNNNTIISIWNTGKYDSMFDYHESKIIKVELNDYNITFKRTYTWANTWDKPWTCIGRFHDYDRLIIE